PRRGGRAAGPARSRRAGRGPGAPARAAGAVFLEPPHAVREGEERVVLGKADVLAGLPLRAVLAQDDRPPAHRLPAEALHSEPLRVAVAAVPARALPLLVCHRSRTSRKNLERLRPARPDRRSPHATGTAAGEGADAVDPHSGTPLPVATRPTIVLALLELEDADLVVAAVPDDRRRHRGLVEQGSAHLGALVPADEEHLAQRHLLPHR